MKLDRTAATAARRCQQLDDDNDDNSVDDEGPDSVPSSFHHLAHGSCLGCHLTLGVSGVSVKVCGYFAIMVGGVSTSLPKKVSGSQKDIYFL